MFTGIVEEIGVIKNITKGVNSEKLLIQCNKVLEETKLGDSICTNGVCLTVTEINDHSFQADEIGRAHVELQSRTDISRMPSSA